MVAVTTTLGLVSAIVIRDHVRAVVLLGVLSFAIQRVFHRYAQQTQGHAQVEALYRFTRTLSGSHDADEVARVVLTQVRDVVRANVAELVLVDEDGSVRMRLAGEDDLEVGGDTPAESEWWAPARLGEPVLLTAASHRGPGPAEPVDAMAVPVALGDAAGVLIVTGSLPDVPTFTADHLRLMEALAAHAGVALTNVRLVERLRHIGLHDALTGLPNRRKLLADLQRTAEAPEPASGVAGVLLFDLDRFKEINDALGHVIGDQVLREIGRRLVEQFGDRATVARLGGDEFALAVPHADTTDEVIELAKQLRRAVEEPIGVGELALTTQASIGVCFSPEHGTDPELLLQRADVAMYAAKQSREGIRVYRIQDDQNTPRRLALMADLRAAVEGGAIEVVYQPKVDPVTRQVLGAEALSRWQNRGATVTPDEFIPLAERSGLILPLTRHVLDTAVGACAAWRRAGHHLSVAVNLSPLVITNQTLIGEVRRTLARHGVPAEALTLEITETGVMEDPVNSMKILESLRTLGVKLSIDDFGTGHSSLGRLAEFPVHEMKIDKRLIQSLTTDRSHEALTHASLYLGQALGLHVVAEGVETEAEFEHLRRLGCDSVQGYYVSRPVPAEQFLQWLDAWQRTTESQLAVAAVAPIGPAGVTHQIRRPLA
jgi:diguanylate cyclase (GGDEF)-like protein